MIRNIKIELNNSGKLGFALSIWFLLGCFYCKPELFLYKTDDFGYAQALVNTIWNNSLSHSNWLAPTNFVPVAMQYLVYLTSKNFLWSSYGFTFAFFVFSFAAFIFLLRRFTVDIFTAVSLAMLIFLHPFFIHVSTDFTGFTLYIFFLILSLLTYRFGLKYFLLVIFLGFFTRQSAVLMLVYPVLDILFAKRSIKSKSVSLLTIAVFFLVLVYLDSLWHKGFAAGMISNPATILRGFGLIRFLHYFSVGLFFCIPFFALASFGAKQNLRALIKQDLFFKLVIFFFLLSMGEKVTNLIEEQNSLAIKWAIYRLSVLSVFLVDFRKLRPNLYILLAMISMAFLVMKGQLWDYYITDFFIFMLLGYVYNMRKEVVCADSVPNSLIKRQLVMAIFLVSISIPVFSRLNKSNVYYRDAFLVYENAFREKKIKVEDGSNLNFGHL